DRDASGQNRKYQYIGTPFTNVRSDVTYYGARMKYLDEVQGKWVSVKNNETIVPFRGYGFTQLTANEIKTQTGTLVSTANRDLPVSYTASGLKGQNLLANSWMAPIDITAMTVDDFDNAEATIVFFHTGSGNEYAASSGEGASAGQYKSVPINSAQSLGYPYIPPMQGFMVAATADGKLTLDYDRMVLQPALSGSRSNTRAYAPRRMAAYDDADEEPATDLGDPGLIRRQQRTVRIDVTNGVFTDELYIFSHPAFSTGFDNGWEAGKIISARYAPQLAVRSTEGDMSVLATPLMDSLYIAFRAGAEAENLITFESEETGLYMLDLRTNIAVPVETGYYYRFTDTSEELTTRFLLFRHDFSGGGDDPGREGTPTGLEVLRGHDGTLHLLLVDSASEAMVFDAAGRLVKRIGAGEEGLTLPQQGVYMVSVQTPSGIVTKKIIY
ncbi:MAG: T9SS type A sorting domain-containing protein, partial [Paludibacteraceae bacterium]|nr:T9SS type A sorting domain-containing protein [Paludibacteraceae bacterium]